MRPSSILPIFFVLASLSTNVIAQQSSGGNGGNSLTNSPAPTNNENSNPATTNAPSRTQTQEDEPEEQENTTQSGEDTPQSTGTDDEEEPPSRTSQSNVVITPTGSSGDDDEDAPSLSQSNTVTISRNPSATETDEAPPPKYTPPDNARYTVPDYPPPAVPNTKNAPYMQRSDLPEGTVFIAVGAALGLFGLIAFAWRMVVAWQLRRSIKRANAAASSDSKAGLLGRYDAPSATKKSFYSAGVNGSSLSLDHLGSSRTGLGQTPNTSLFFSPTANTGSPVHQNRGSAYLPAGYYAPAASPGLGFNQSRDSLPRPRPATRDSPAHGTPPASPLLLPQARRPSPGQGHHQNASVSSRTSLGVQPGGRTPSTYLEDMLDVPFPEDGSMTTDQAKRNSRRKSGHSYGGYNGSGSRR
ncbi:hypothetical protein ABW19_dt0207374 [Dactylella cylindrospora]|nr:hypothetical protein ABW19_dt0207374 [Dactylella cylindrospora]